MGIFLLTLSVFVLSGPGRIDSIDGQFRYDVAANLLSIGKPVLRDPALLRLGLPGVDGERYSAYGPAPSYLAVPAVWLGRVAGDPFGELSRFLFSHENALLVAAAIALLAVLFLELGVGARRAVAWAVAAAFGSMLWIGATTVLEQGQHAFFVLLGTYLAWKSGRERSRLLAVGAGLAAGTLVMYQIPYVMHLPLIGLAGLRFQEDRWMPDRGSLGRYTVFLAAASVGVLTALLFNFNRFGTLLLDPRDHLGSHPPLPGNPLVGIPTLLFSPGKGLLLFCPIVALCIIGLARLRHVQPMLVVSVAATSALHLAFVGSLSIFHGDWCWGPRYLMVVVALLAVGLPFALESASLRWRRFAAAIIFLGVVSNLLGLSLIHERFFHEKGLSIYFWKDDPGYYWRNSNYFSRFGEVERTIREGIPPDAERFTNSAYPGLLTYVFVRGGPPQVDAAWIRRFRIFFRPRPWPFWLAAERSSWARGRGFPAFWWLVGGVASVGAGGALLTWTALRQAERAPTAS